MDAHRFVNWLIVLSAVAMVGCWYYADHLPPPRVLSSASREEPVQDKTREKPFDTSVADVQYRVTPRFTYDITGLVVSLHDSLAWWDYAHREWNDHINVADLCVVWGNNVKRDAYRQASFTHTQWECWWQTGAVPPEKMFDGDAMSNNHVVTADPALAKRLRDVRIGDEVRFRGYLIDYTTYLEGRPTGSRNTSVVRTDSGEGACEIVWIDELQIIRSHNRPWRVAAKVAAGLLAAGILAWIVMPAKLDT